MLPCDPRDGEGPLGPSWSEHGGCISGSWSPKQTNNKAESTRSWKHTLKLVVAQELSKY